MEVRIESRVQGSTTIVTIAGRLGASGFRELRRLCRSLEGPLMLDLSGLVSANAEGLEAIRELERQGVELSSASPFIRLLLANGGDPPARPKHVAD